MPGIRKVYGPFHPERHRLAQGECIDFHFHGIRDDHSMAAWVLRYTASTRQFMAISRQIGEVGGPKMRSLKIDVAKLPPDKEKFLCGEKPNVETGRITDILRRRLKPEHLAQCAALSMTNGRT